VLGAVELGVKADGVPSIMRSMTMARRVCSVFRIIPVLLVVFVIACSSDLPSEPTRIEAPPTLPTVTRVIDGDTVVVEGVGTVRLIGVDTPETVDPQRPVEYFGTEASDFARHLATGKRVRLEFDQDRMDRYGRTLAYVYLQPENLLLNAEIIRQGYGFAYTQFPFRMMEYFRALEPGIVGGAIASGQIDSESRSDSPSSGLV
jgi:micrococcal nuclease